MIRTDYHMHSTHSADGHASVREMCEAALAAGLSEIGFAEHLDFDRDDPHYGYLDDAAYTEAIAEARDAFAGRLAVRKGVEFDFRTEFGEEPGEVLASMEFDYLMGSVHTAAGRQIWNLADDPPSDAELRDLLRDYLSEVEALAASGWCHVIGHFDYVYKQMPDRVAALRDEAYWDGVDRILARCIAGGVAIEINTHHILDRDLGLAADGEILARYAALGGRRVAVGSDAHRPSDVAHGFAQAEAALREAGFAEVTGFERGRPYAVPVTNDKR
jgi:histidinol-phosphatase (PHP family)